MKKKVLRPKYAARFLGVSRTTLWRLSETDPNFPRKVIYSPRCVGWIESSLIKYLEDKEAGL